MLCYAMLCLVRRLLLDGRGVEPRQEVGRDSVVEARRDEHRRAVLLAGREELAVALRQRGASVRPIVWRPAHGGAAGAPRHTCKRREAREVVLRVFDARQAARCYPLSTYARGSQCELMACATIAAEAIVASSSVRTDAFRIEQSSRLPGRKKREGWLLCKKDRWTLTLDHPLAWFCACAQHFGRRPQAHSHVHELLRLQHLSHPCGHDEKQECRAPTRAWHAPRCWLRARLQT